MLIELHTVIGHLYAAHTGHTGSELLCEAARGAPLLRPHEDQAA
jgi:hypothetical protein